MARVGGRTIEAIEWRMGSVKVGVRNLPPPRTGCVPGNEQCVSLSAKEADSAWTKDFLRLKANFHAK
jgi:hypothetical protein